MLPSTLDRVHSWLPSLRLSDSRRRAGADLAEVAVRPLARVARWDAASRHQLGRRWQEISGDVHAASASCRATLARAAAAPGRLAAYAWAHLRGAGSHGGIACLGVVVGLAAPLISRAAYVVGALLDRSGLDRAAEVLCFLFAEHPLPPTAPPSASEASCSVPAGAASAQRSGVSVREASLRERGAGGRPAP